MTFAVRLPVTEDESVHVEVAYAEADRQFLRAVTLQVPATIADAIRASGIELELGLDPALLSVGIWSKPSSFEKVLSDGDRVEIYRPLKIDPKEARRKRARASKSPV